MYILNYQLSCFLENVCTFNAKLGVSSVFQYDHHQNTTDQGNASNSHNYIHLGRKKLRWSHEAITGAAFFKKRIEINKKILCILRVYKKR